MKSEPPNVGCYISKQSPLDLRKLKVRPLAERRSLTKVEDVLVEPDSAPPPCPEPVAALVRQCAENIRAARQRGASVILM